MSQQRPTPKTKQQLITLLKEQLETVQDQITNMQQTLQAERQKRKQLKSELQQKQKKIQQLIQHQSKTLGDKVTKSLYNTLQAANKMRAQAEAQVRKLTQDNNLFDEKLIQKDINVLQSREKVFLNAKKISVLQQKTIDAVRKEENLQQKKNEITKNLQAMKKQCERIQRQEKQLRANIQNAKKLRMYLNKHLENNVRNPKEFVKSKNSNNLDNFWNGGD